MIPSFYPREESLYGMYIKELGNRDILETEKGFATYSFFEDSVYIEDIFVHPDYRNTNEASDMADEIGKIAKEKGYKKMIGSVVPGHKGSTTSIKVLLAYGFKLDGVNNNFILLKKDLV